MKAIVSNYIVRLGWTRVFVSLAVIDPPLRADLLPASIDDFVVVGLPDLEVASPCKLAVSYVYATEERELTSRIRKTHILILMHLLKAKQIKDVVEKTGNIIAVAVLGLNEKTYGVLTRLLETLGYSWISASSEGESIEAKCEPRELEDVAISRLEFF